MSLGYERQSITRLSEYQAAPPTSAGIKNKWAMRRIDAESWRCQAQRQSSVGISAIALTRVVFLADPHEYCKMVSRDSAHQRLLHDHPHGEIDCHRKHRISTVSIEASRGLRWTLSRDCRAHLRSTRASSGHQLMLRCRGKYTVSQAGSVRGGLNEQPINDTAFASLLLFIGTFERCSTLID